MIDGLLVSLRASLVLLILSTLIMGGLYPIAVTVVSHIVFPQRSHGSLIERQGRIVGSQLLGQSFTQAKYFWGRPSATQPPYNAAASAGSNFSPANPELLVAVDARIDALQKADPNNKERIPVDLLTASGSGLDPHISVAAAEYQVPRVARARQMKEGEVRALLHSSIEWPALGLIGEARVNVLKLNLALDGK
jgi:potassium-transporting ATPase KdpC subunit